jgi:hypothetical protein
MRGALVGLTTLLAAGAILTGSETAGSASAASYEVGACAGAASLVNNSWQPFNNDPAYLETTANCGISDITEGSPITSGLAASDVLRLTTNVPAGAIAGWQVAAPAGDVISGASVNRDLYRQAEGWAPQIVEADGNPLAGESCSSNGDCEIAGEATDSGLDTTSLAIELVCDPEPVQLTACANGFSQHFARVELNSATVTITDDQPPQITSTSGALFTSGLVRGTISGTINSSDNSGVQYARVYVDGNQVAEQMLACDFTQPAPCPASSTNQFSLDTSSLSEGPHKVQAAVVDAAGNQTLGAPVQITVENASPPAPTGLQVNGKPAGAWIDQPATITWTNPSEPTDDPISHVNWIACTGTETSIPASGCEAPQHQETPLSSLTFNPAQDPAFSSQPQASYTVFVWLEDAIGNTDQADAAPISVGYQTSPPPRPTSIKASGSGPYTITLGAPSHLAPLTATDWIACKGPTSCTPTQTSPGLSFRFEPSRTAQFQRSPYGSYTIRAWLVDEATNANPADSATLAITHNKPGKPSPRLHILSVTRATRALRVRGTATHTLIGHVTIVAHYTLKGRSGSVQKTVRASDGRWSAVLGLPPGAPTSRVTVLYRRSAHWLAQTVTRYVHHPRGG